MGTGIETERKFALTRGQELPSLSSVAKEGPPFESDAVSIYYDTPDYRLNAARQVVRHRVGGPQSGWQAKFPTDHPDERVEVIVAERSERLPAQLRELVAGCVGESPLYPVAEVRVRRTSRQLADTAGTVLGVVSVDRVTATVAGRVQEWTEAEVELVSGDSGLLDRVEGVLGAAGIARSTSRSKLGQALAEETTRAEEALRRGPDVARVVLGYLGAQVGLMQSLEGAVLSDEFDAVHRCRVAVRRMRCTMASFSRALRVASTQALRQELRWYGELLGAVRDAEVQQGRLARAVVELPAALSDGVAEEIAVHLDRIHHRARAALVAGMETERYRRLMVTLERLLADPPLDRMAAEPASMLLPTMFEAAMHHVGAVVDRAVARPDELTRWHEVRKAAKAARYAAEAIAPVAGPADANRVALWNTVTSALGEAQDAATAIQVIAEVSYVVGQRGRPRTAYDQLRNTQDARLREAIESGRAALQRALAP